MPESIVKIYYDKLKEGKIIGAKCKKCGNITFPPTTRCTSCKGDEVEWFVLSGKGQLMYCSHGMAPPPHPRFEELAPYAYGHIKLEEGVFTQAIISNVKADTKELQSYFEKGSVNVEADILEMKDIPVLAFKVV